MSLRDEKVRQVPQILEELGIDLWMVVEKESGVLADPVSDYLIGTGATWLSFFVFTRRGRKVALVGNLDKEKFDRLAIFDTLLTYQNSPKEQLLGLLSEEDPEQIALDYSVNSPAADGLSHGRFLQLQHLLKDGPYAGRFVSAEDIIAKIRGRKSAREIEYIREAIEVTQQIFETITARVRPGWTEKEVAALFHQERDKLGLEPSWEADHNPSVFAGPQTIGAHSGPTDKTLEPGEVFNMDAGVKINGYCSDLQRTWYILKPGEYRPPATVMKGFETIRQAIRKAFEALKPGVTGIEIDRIARQYIAGQGFGEFPHALGHQVGREAHDGGALLGPEWERYGNLPFIPLEENQVFTIEPRLYLPEQGVVTMEEMVRITADGAEWLSDPQEDIFLIS